MSDDRLFFMKERTLDYPVFDSDNHMYENTEAFIKFLPKEYEGVIKYIDYDGRTKLAVKDRISRVIPTRPSNGWRLQVASRTIPLRAPFRSPDSTRSLTSSLATR